MALNRLGRSATAAGIRPLLKTAFRLLVRLRLYGPIVWFFARMAREIGGDPRQPTLLAITLKRFRGDPEALAGSGRYHVLGLDFEWMAILASQFYGENVPRGAVYNRGTDAAVTAAQDRYRDFLHGFLPRLYRRLGVDGVLSACIDYPQDHDWGVVSQAIGAPFVVLHRENLVANPGMVQHFENWSGSLGRFGATHVVVHNETVRQAFIRSGYVDPAQISTLGCVRMDGFLDRIRSGRDTAARRARPLVVFFSFPPGIGLERLMGGARLWPDEADGIGFFEVCRATHVAIARLAQARPDVDVLIKPKWGGNWTAAIERMLGEAGIDAARLPNLTIRDDVSAQDVILEATVVAGYGSTVLLEAAVAGKPTVVPYFAEMLEPKYREEIFLSDRLEALFDVARDETAFGRLVEERLADPTVDAACMDARRQDFDDLVSSVEGHATDRYCDLLERLIADAAGRPARQAGDAARPAGGLAGVAPGSG